MALTKNFLTISLLFLSFGLTSFHNGIKSEAIKEKKSISFTEAESLYATLSSSTIKAPSQESFLYAFEGFQKLKSEGKIEKDLLTIIDFSLSSNQKRMWIIDMNTMQVLAHSLVSHGRNSGEEYATNFSNKINSFQSSLGFYATAETYHGKHGYSLRLDGLESGINDLARERAVVIHGAAYVSESFIQKQGRLGRSHGCPALPMETANQIIDLIKDKSCLFIFHPSMYYLKKSHLLS
jgi:hypothetical protein